jgi:hypothetical protein
MKGAMMFGEPQDVEGECNARVFIADNYGDGCATIRCQLALEHNGMHREQYKRDSGTVTIAWVTDERARCDHGCGQWDHDHRDEISCPKHADDHEFSDCAHCHPDTPALTCTGCGKTYFYEAGHKRHCLKEPYTCVTCGESGMGPHDWPYGCPVLRRRLAAGGNADGSTSDPSSLELPAPVDEILTWFWQTTFAELHGFSFDE